MHASQHRRRAHRRRSYIEEDVASADLLCSVRSDLQHFLLSLLNDPISTPFLQEWRRRRRRGGGNGTASRRDDCAADSHLSVQLVTSDDEYEPSPDPVALFQHEASRSTLAKINKCIELSYRWAWPFYYRNDELPLPHDRQILIDHEDESETTDAMDIIPQL